MPRSRSIRWVAQKTVLGRARLSPAKRKIFPLCGTDCQVQR